MSNKLTSVMTRDDMQEIARILQEALEPILREVAQRRADDVLGRLLDTNDDDLRHRVNAVIRTLVAEEIDKHIEVRVGWKA